MNKAETAYLLQILMQLFPGTKLTADELTVSLWQELLSDLPAELALAAAKRAAVKTNFMPSIHEIRSEAAQAMMEQQGGKSAGEAWAGVRRAISNFGYTRPEKAREALGEDVWKAVQMMGGWTELCMSEAGDSVLSAQFERRYEAEQKRHGERLLIPEGLRQEMKRLMGDRLLLPESGERAY